MTDVKCCLLSAAVNSNDFLLSFSDIVLHIYLQIRKVLLVMCTLSTCY